MAKVYSFRKFDMEADENRVGARKATRHAIQTVKGELIEETEEEVADNELDGDGRPAVRTSRSLRAAPAAAYRRRRCAWALRLIMNQPNPFN
jgi:hypothetical protein